MENGRDDHTVHDEFEATDFDIDNINECFNSLIRITPTKDVRSAFMSLYREHRRARSDILPIRIVSKRLRNAEDEIFTRWMQFAIGESLELNMDPIEWVTLASTIGVDALVKVVCCCFDSGIISPQRCVEALEICGSIYNLQGFASKGMRSWKQSLFIRKQYNIEQTQLYRSSILAFQDKPVFPRSENIDSLHLFPNRFLEHSALVLESYLGSAEWPSSVTTSFMTNLSDNLKKYINREVVISHSNFLGVITLLMRYGSSRPAVIVRCTGDEREQRSWFGLRFGYFSATNNILKTVSGYLPIASICEFLDTLFRSANPYLYRDTYWFWLSYICENIDLRELSSMRLAPKDRDNLFHLAVLYWLTDPGDEQVIRCERILDELLIRQAYPAYPSWYHRRNSCELMYEYLHKNATCYFPSKRIPHEILSRTCYCLQNSLVQRYGRLVQDAPRSPANLTCQAASALSTMTGRLPDLTIGVPTGASATITSFVRAHAQFKTILERTK